MAAKKPDPKPRRVPPFGRRNHELTHSQAKEMRQRYIKKYGGKPGALQAAAYGRNIFEKVLKQKGCVGVRFYPGIDDDGNVTVLFCAVDKEGNDILAGVIGDTPWWCPPFCSSANGILSF